mgnify:CR=1 FL=1
MDGTTPAPPSEWGTGLRNIRAMTATYAVDDAVATITLDDGKVNALSPAMQAAINAALDQAETDIAAGTVKAVVIAGNDRVFSGGFDLSVFASGDADAGHAMLVIDKYVRRLIRIADRHVILEKGRVVWAGSSDALDADRGLWHRYLGV